MTRVPDLVRRFVLSAEERRRQRAALDAFRQTLHRELDRSRRYERPLAILAASLAGPPASEDRTRLSTAIASSLRSSDAFCIAERRLYLLLPEADGAAAERSFERIRALEPNAVDELSVAIATFPDDGVTLGSLLALLRRVDVARRRRLSRIDGSVDVATSGGQPTSHERAG